MRWLLLLTLVASLLACGKGESGKDERSVAEAPKPSEAMAEDASPGIDAAAATRGAAVAVLKRFGAALLGGDDEALREELRIPADLNEKQVAFFLRELGSGEHLSQEGLAQVMQKDFGPLRERLGSKAAEVAEGAMLPLAEAYAFGDLESAAILHWDGQRFRVAAVHKLVLSP